MIYPGPCPECRSTKKHLFGCRVAIARRHAHNSFDRLHQKGPFTRQQAYWWLRELLGIPAKRAHIGMLTLKQLRKVISASRKMRRPQMEEWLKSHGVVELVLDNPGVVSETDNHGIQAEN